MRIINLTPRIERSQCRERAINSTSCSRALEGKREGGLGSGALFFLFRKPVGTDSIVDYYTKREWEEKRYWCRMKLNDLFSKEDNFLLKLKLKLFVFSKYIKFSTNKQVIYVDRTPVIVRVCKTSVMRPGKVILWKENLENLKKYYSENLGKWDGGCFQQRHLSLFLTSSSISKVFF